MGKPAKKTGAKSDSSSSPLTSYEAIAAALKSGNTSNFYLLFGDEDYLIERVIKMLERLLIAPGCQDTDLYSLDCAGNAPDSEKLYEWIATPPFLSSRRLVVLKNTALFSTKSPDTPTRLEEYTNLFRKIPEFSCLVLWEDKVDRRKKVMYEAAISAGVVSEIDRRSADELSRWAAQTLSRNGVKIRVDAIGSLVDRTDGSMRVMENEVQKIILSAQNRGITELSLEDIDEMCIPDIRGSVFQMTDAIGAKNTERALRVLDTLISMKEPIPRIRFMLSRHIRQLICAKELGSPDRVIATLKVVPFVARNLVNQSRSFSMSELLELYEACAASDLSVKTGKLEDRLSLEMLLLSAGKG